jgi:hypothetical protein
VGRGTKWRLIALKEITAIVAITVVLTAAYRSLTALLRARIITNKIKEYIKEIEREDRKKLSRNEFS